MLLVVPDCLSGQCTIGQRSRHAFARLCVPLALTDSWHVVWNDWDVKGQFVTINRIPQPRYPPLAGATGKPALDAEHAVGEGRIWHDTSQDCPELAVMKR
jgi:hypothetical protein